MLEKKLLKSFKEENDWNRFGFLEDYSGSIEDEMEENYAHGTQEIVKAQEDGGLMKLKASHQNYKGASRTRQSDIS